MATARVITAFATFSHDSPPMARVESAIVMWSHTDALIVPARVVESTACEIIWILDIEVSGHVYRFADEPAEVINSQGDVLVYREGLSKIEHSTASDGSTDLAIPIEINSEVMWAQAVADYRRVERASAVLRRWGVGSGFDSARVVLSGWVEGGAYGGPLESLTFSLRRPGWSSGDMIPTAGMIVDATTWPSSGRPAFEPDVKILGAAYPIIIGSPGLSGGSITAATEALAVEVEITPVGGTAERLMVAGHSVAAPSISLYDYTDDDNPEVLTSLAVTEYLDLAGRTVSLVEPAGGFTSDILAGRVYYVGWPDPGGIKNPFGSGALRGAGDVIEWIITRWTSLEFDGARHAAVRDILNLYKIDTHINIPMDPMEWLASAVLAILPVEPRNGEDGIYYQMRRPGVGRHSSVMHLDTGTYIVDRTSSITISADDIVNEVTVEYCPDRSSDRYRSRVILGGEFGGPSSDALQLGLGTDARVRGSYRASLSLATYGRLPMTVSASAVCDPATASRIAGDVIERMALPTRTVEMLGQCELEDRLRVGDIVTISDADTSMVDQLAEVRDITVGGATVPLLLELIDDPVIG